MKRLIDAVVQGFGLSAGKVLFDKAVREVEEELREPTPEEQEKTQLEEAKRVRAAEKARAEAEKQAEKARKKEAAEIDAELAALKRKVGK